MSAFENFIQLELPKRPYLDTDAAQESVLVRRGPGPRQLQPISLAEGQVLAKVGGVIVGASVNGLPGSINKLIVPVTTASAMWEVTHGFNTTDAIVQVTDIDGFVILPQSMQIINSTTIRITFGTPQTGTLRVIFLN